MYKGHFILPLSGAYLKIFDVPATLLKVWSIVAARRDVKTGSGLILHLFRYQPHSTRLACFWDSFICSMCQNFLLFHGWIIYPISFVIHPLIDSMDYWVYLPFYLLAIVSSVSVSMSIQIFVQGPAFSSLEYIPESGVTEFWLHFMYF